MNALNEYLKALYDADWENPLSVIRFSSAIRLDELKHAQIFENTRIFLTWHEETGGSSLTATGNLTRASVAQIFDRLRLESVYRDSLRSIRKVINEMDVWPLHEIRLLAEYGKLTTKRNKRLTLSKLGRDYLQDAYAGELFRRLFLTYFRTMDLCYLINVREVPEIQATLAIILWRLEQVAENWRGVKGIGEQILPPRLTAWIRSQEFSAFVTPDFLVASYVLQPLREFGLLEVERETEFHIGDKDKVRTTALFRRFISFAPISSPAQN